MKVTLPRERLMKSLAHVQGIIEKARTIPILSNVLLTMCDGTLTLTGTDMEITVVEQVEASGAADGACTAPAATLFEIVRRLSNGAEVTLECGNDADRLDLRSGRYHTGLMALPVADYPSMPAGPCARSFAIRSSALRGLIDRTRFAISTEETRYFLNGIYLHAAETGATKVLRAVATDGNRLARVEEPLPEGAGGMPGVIVPRKTVGGLRKLIDGITEDVEIAPSKTHIQFKVGAVTLTSKLIDGTFPEYDRVIPRDNDRVLRVAKKDFADAVARVSVISLERSRFVKLSLERNMVTISAWSADQGMASEELDGEHVIYEGGPFDAKFQARYLADITDQISDNVEFRFGKTMRDPVIIVDPADASALFVLMGIV